MAWLASSQFHVPGCRYLPSANYRRKAPPICFVSPSLSPTRRVESSTPCRVWFCAVCGVVPFSSRECRTTVYSSRWPYSALPPMLGKTPQGASRHGTAVLGIAPLHPADGATVKVDRQNSERAEDRSIHTFIFLLRNIHTVTFLLRNIHTVTFLLRNIHTFCFEEEASGEGPLAISSYDSATISKYCRVALSPEGGRRSFGRNADQPFSHC
jgi:hypothetical protein